MNSPEVKALIEAAEQVVTWFSKTTFKSEFTDLKSALEAVRGSVVKESLITQTIEEVKKESDQ